MIEIYTSLREFDTDKIIYDNNAYFYEHVMAAEFGNLQDEVIKKIDNAIVLDRNTGTVKTERGITSIDNLSTGCKTVLNYVYIAERQISVAGMNVSQCGYNALDVLFDVCDILKYPVRFILLHKDNLFKCKQREYLIDKERVINNLLYL